MHVWQLKLKLARKAALELKLDRCQLPFQLKPQEEHMEGTFFDRTEMRWPLGLKLSFFPYRL